MNPVTWADGTRTRPGRRPSRTRVDESLASGGPGGQPARPEVAPARSFDASLLPVDSGLSPSIGRQLLELGLLDEIDLHVLPVLLGDGIRLYDSPGGSPVALEFVNGDPVEEINVRYRPVGRDTTTARE